MDTAFANLRLPEYRASRFKPMSSVMPTKEDLTIYFAVMTQAHLWSAPDNAGPVTNFDDLFAQLGMPKTEQSLLQARKRALIYEADKIFPPGLGHVLCPADAFVYMRPLGGAKVSTFPPAALFGDEEFFVAIDESFGAFELTDATNRWYCLVADDDPVVFFAVNEAVSSELASNFEKNALRISPDFAKWEPRED